MTSNAKYNKENHMHAKAAPMLKAGNKEDEIYLLTKFHDFLGVAGVGFDIYCTYFKLAVELKMSFGFRNLLVTDSKRYPSDVFQYVESLRYLKSRNFQLSITFE